MTERSDEELMLAFQAGDEEAFSVLVTRHQRHVVNLSYRYLQNRADAEDLAQDVFLRVHKARKRYRPDAKFTTWLYRVAVNTSLNEIRSRRSRPTHGAAAIPVGGAEGAPVAAAEAGPDAAAETNERAARVRDAVAQLPERQRMALLLNKFQGLGYEELAGAMEMTIPAVKSLLVRARENVRKQLEPYLGHGVSRQRGTA